MTNQEFREKWLRKMSKPDEGCIFYEGWQGYCGSTVDFNSSFCDKHNSVECWACDEQPVKKCAVQECDTIECRLHPHYKDH